MPIWADPARGETVRLLADDDATLLATFVAPPAPRPTASDLRLVEGTDPARFAAVAARDLPGVRVVTGLDEAAALTDVGATVVGTDVHHVRDGLQVEQPPLEWAAPRLPPGCSLTAVDADADAVTSSILDAYAAGHPDHAEKAEAVAAGSVRALLAGDLLGPVHDDASGLVVDAGGAIVAGIVVTTWERIGDEWAGGPWVAELFRVPSPNGGLLGRALLARAVLVASLDGHDAIGITVAAAHHRATSMVSRLGFRPRFHRVRLDLPGSWPGRP